MTLAVSALVFPKLPEAVGLSQQALFFEPATDEVQLSQSHSDSHVLGAAFVFWLNYTIYSSARAAVVHHGARASDGRGWCLLLSCAVTAADRAVAAGTPIFVQSSFLVESRYDMAWQSKTKSSNCWKLVGETNHLPQ